MNVKQVIVIRKDLKMRRGKECAQASHASMAWLTRRLRPDQLVGQAYYGITLTPAEQAWIKGSFAKVTLQVESEEDLQEVYRQAKAAGLEASFIIDSGKTEFDGVPTPTAVAIGPDEVEKLDRVTGKETDLFKSGKLKLY